MYKKFGHSLLILALVAMTAACAQNRGMEATKYRADSEEVDPRAKIMRGGNTDNEISQYLSVTFPDLNLVDPLATSLIEKVESASFQIENLNDFETGEGVESYEFEVVTRREGESFDLGLHECGEGETAEERSRSIVQAYEASLDIMIFRKNLSAESGVKNQIVETTALEAARNVFEARMHVSEDGIRVALMLTRYIQEGELSEDERLEVNGRGGVKFALLFVRQEDGKYLVFNQFGEEIKSDVLEKIMNKCEQPALVEPVEDLTTPPSVPTVEGGAADPDAPTVEDLTTPPSVSTVEGGAADPDAPTVEGGAVDPDAPTVEGGAADPDAPARDLRPAEFEGSTPFRAEEGVGELSEENLRRFGNDFGEEE